MTATYGSVLGRDFFDFQTAPAGTNSRQVESLKRQQVMKWPPYMEYKLVCMDGPEVVIRYFPDAYALTRYVAAERRKDSFKIMSLWMWDVEPVRLFDFGPHITAF